MSNEQLEGGCQQRYPEMARICDELHVGYRSTRGAAKRLLVMQAVRGGLLCRLELHVVQHGLVDPP